VNNEKMRYLQKIVDLVKCSTSPSNHIK